MASLGELVVSLSANTAAFHAALDKAAYQSQQRMAEISRVVKNTAELIGTTLSVRAFVGFIKSSIDAADEMNDLSQKIGISIKDLATWKLAADQSGTSLESVAKGVKGLATYMVQNGEALKSAGITAKDANGALIQLGDLFHAMPDGVEKTALAVKLFGKAGLDMIPMLNLGSQGLAEAADKARAYGEKIAALAPLADQFNDRLAELKLSSSALGLALGSDVLAVLGPLAEQLANSKNKADESAGSFHVLGESLKAIVVFGSEVGFVLKAIGTEIGGIAAQAAALLNGEFRKAGYIHEAMMADAKERRAEQDKFTAGIAGLKFDGKPATPGFVGPPVSPEIEIANRIRKQRELDKRVRALLGDSTETSGRSSKESVDILAIIARGLEKETAKIDERNKAIQRTQFLIDDLQKTYDRQTSAALEAMSIQSVSQHNLAVALAQVKEEGDKAAESLSKSDYLKTFGADVYATALQKIADKTAAQKQLVIDLAAEQERLNGMWQFGAAKALQSYIDDVANVAKSTEALVRKAFSGMEEALVNFVKTGKLDFKSLADSIISDLIRIEIRQNITGKLAKAIDDGSIGKFFSGLFGGGKAGGGAVDSSRYYLVGENGPELFAPGKSGSIVPNEVAFGGGGGIVVNIIESPGNGGQQQQRTSGGVNVLDVFVEQIKSSIASDISRGSGAVPAAMSQTFGLSRAVGAY